MEKLKQFDWVLIALILLGLRSLYDANMAQAMVVVCFSTLVGLKRFLESRQVKDLDKETREELERIKANMSAITIKNSVKAVGTENNPVRFF